MRRRVPPLRKFPLQFSIRLYHFLLDAICVPQLDSLPSKLENNYSSYYGPEAAGWKLFY